MTAAQPDVPEPEDADAPRIDFDFWADGTKLQALLHPLRVRAYIEAVKGPVSAKELADRLGVPLQRMSYHVRHLADEGLLRVVSRTPRRGAVETHYRAVASLEIDTTRFIDSPEIFRTWYRIIWGLIAEDADRALDQGAGEREDFKLARVHLALDRRGRDRLIEELYAFYARLREIHEEFSVDPAPDAEEVNVLLMTYDGSRESGRNGPIWVSLTEDPDTIPED